MNITATDASYEAEGFLTVTVVGRQSQIERNGTVCSLNWQSAQLFCQSLGFLFADWRKSLKNLEQAAE